MDKSCSCVPDLYDCGNCTRKLHEKIWSTMSEDKKNYDRHFDPVGSGALDGAMLDYYGDKPTCCSCHIHAPCSFCVNGGWEDESE